MSSASNEESKFRANNEHEIRKTRSIMDMKRMVLGN